MTDVQNNGKHNPIYSTAQVEGGPQSPAFCNGSGWGEGWVLVAHISCFCFINQSRVSWGPTITRQRGGWLCFSNVFVTQATKHPHIVEFGGAWCNRSNVILLLEIFIREIQWDVAGRENSRIFYNHRLLNVPYPTTPIFRVVVLHAIFCIHLLTANCYCTRKTAGRSGCQLVSVGIGRGWFGSRARKVSIAKQTQPLWTHAGDTNVTNVETIIFFSI